MAPSTVFVERGQEAAEQRIVLAFIGSEDRVGHEVRQLDEAGRRTVDEEWDLDQLGQAREPMGWSVDS